MATMPSEWNALPTPCTICDLGVLRANAAVLRRIRGATGCRILLALKGFACFSVFPLLREALDGTCASSPHEARLGAEEFGGEVHAYAPAYSERDVADLLPFVTAISFNSFEQWRRFRPAVERAPRRIACGLRINPDYSEVKVALYNPCAANSRLGVTRAGFDGQDLAGLSGLHFHTMCEQNADTLERTLAVVEPLFGAFLGRMAWINFGGGHHLTRADYDEARLCRVLAAFRARHPNLTVYLEPGEAVALNAGALVASVLDIVRNGMDIAILDTSAAAHMPDVLEMPYRPEVLGADRPGVHPHTYRLGGLTCLAGDVIGDYSFPQPLRVGSRVVFLDMGHYTTVKTTTFNGVRLPSLATYDPATGAVRLVREFGYGDYKNRLS